MSIPLPAYLDLYRSGELARRVERARRGLARCVLCPRVCAVDRLAGERGKCRTGRRAVVWSCHPHFGEEPPLVGQGGSGTIFFSACNLECIYCQNYEISQLDEGSEVTDDQLASMMLRLQAMGCHNINLVSPSHVVAQILAALLVAVERGLRLPLVYNTGGYDSLVALRLLDGVVDIYMPDMKYADAATGERLSGVAHYPPVNRRAVQEMHRQVGDLEVDERGVARRGLLVRHLVLPGGLAGTEEIVGFLAREISPNTYVNVMDQYHPCHKAHRIAPLARPTMVAEYLEAVHLARRAGLRRGF
ncbi:MAG: 4Fe-4S cluster-binding domain-containing protein [Bacteroidetes bacterium]|nr:4Fe-4S cluster-binding domain-containing protein [Bacteroidota bacterium]MCL5026264.1 4Fe-4S cluster-binding domain-containing protein [Chloroflexota bacterium]